MTIQYNRRWNVITLLYGINFVILIKTMSIELWGLFMCKDFLLSAVTKLHSRNHVIQCQQKIVSHKVVLLEDPFLHSPLVTEVPIQQVELIQYCLQTTYRSKDQLDIYKRKKQKGVITQQLQNSGLMLSCEKV